jgi:palmitoyl-protein thioesterase
MGVDAIPGCFSGFACDVVNFLAKRVVYFSFAQNWFAPAGYFRDVNDMKTYEKDSVFLPSMNNEQISTGELGNVRKERFSSLNAAMLVMFEDDSVIYPKETAWFQQLDTHGNVLPLNATDFYNEDYIGLKNLTETGKVQYVSLPGDHLQFTTDDIKNTFIPFLMK